MQENDFLSGSLRNGVHTSLIGRLISETKEAARDISRDPAGFFASAMRTDLPGGARRRAVLRLGLAVALTIDATLFCIALLVWTRDARPLPQGPEQRLTLINPLGLTRPAPNLPRDDRDAHGGGGGGNHEREPASKGLPPPFALELPVIAPTTKPTLHPPDLPVREILLGDPRMNPPRDELMPTGLTDGVPGPSSDGPGSDHGVGTGKNGGVGKGSGPGLNDGSDGGCCGGSYQRGGRRDASAATKVDTQPVAMNRPRPNYTEEARKNKIQGVVTARVLVGEDGKVKQVFVTNGLPDGLNEEAIRAAMQIRFKPAMRNGAAVSHWISLEIEFNLR